MNRSGRFFVGTLFALALALCAFIPGMWVGGRTVGEHAGLAGGAIVLFTGLLISAAAFVAGAILAYILSARLLRILTVVAGIPALLVAVFIGHGYLKYAGERDAFLDDQIANLPPFTLALSQTEAVAGRAFDEIVFDTAQTRFTVTRTDGSVCTGNLPAQSRDKVRLLTALRGVEILLADRPTVCASGVVLHRADFRIRETLPPETEGTVDMTEACLAEYPELRAMVTAANAVYEANGCR